MFRVEIHDEMIETTSTPIGPVLGREMGTVGHDEEETSRVGVFCYGGK